MDCFEVMYVLMRNKLIDPQFSIPRMNVPARGFCLRDSLSVTVQAQYYHVMPPFEAREI